jgi:hypothetical protein
MDIDSRSSSPVGRAHRTASIPRRLLDHSRIPRFRTRPDTSTPSVIADRVQNVTFVVSLSAPPIFFRTL